MKCARCGMDATWWQCAICGERAAKHDEKHVHGDPPSDRHCMPECSGCKKAEVHCKCEK